MNLTMIDDIIIMVQNKMVYAYFMEGYTVS